MLRGCPPLGHCLFTLFVFRQLKMLVYLTLVSHSDQAREHSLKLNQNFYLGNQEITLILVLASLLNNNVTAWKMWNSHVLWHLNCSSKKKKKSIQKYMGDYRTIRESELKDAKKTHKCREHVIPVTAHRCVQAHFSSLIQCSTRYFVSSWN